MVEQRITGRQQQVDLSEKLFQFAYRSIENDLERSAAVGGTVFKSELKYC
jgi:hypothetical protein